ncbi:MAG TPA: UbiA family prenyltransferase [Azospirillum sp.]|nr:UbiA family prenyltransferase [Azospirillum sp.]
MGTTAVGHLIPWRTALRLGRVSNLPTVWSNVAAGVALAGGTVLDPALPVLLLAASLAYVAGMFLNDAFDRGIDAAERPERPIPAGEVRASSVFGAGFAMLAAAAALLFALGLPAGAAGLALAAAIVAYDVHHKGNSWSPLLMGACRALVYAAAGLAVAPDRTSWALAGGAAALLAYLIGLTYTAKQEGFGAVRNLWPLGFLAVPFAHALAALPTRPEVAAALALFAAWTGWALCLVLRRAGRDIRGAVGAFIAGISLLDGLLIVGAGRPEGIAIGLACWALTLRLQRHVPGT